MKNSKILLITAAILIVGLIAALIVFMQKSAQTQEEMSEMVEMMNFEKEQLEDEFSDLAVQYDGFQVNIQNDSLVTLLGQEKVRVQQLLEELRTTKATNARKIAELRKELSTVRAIMVQYVNQIDSLDRTNKRLVTENREVRQRYQEVSQQAQELEKERTELSQVVSRAAMMEVTDFQMVCLNNRGRKTSRFSQISTLQFNFTLLKNITTSPGNKSVYIRIVRPDGEVLTKSASNTFLFENSQIAYSSVKTIEYAGETLSEVIYWKVEEILQVGVYNADFFIDGNLVGSFPFSIKK